MSYRSGNHLADFVITDDVVSLQNINSRKLKQDSGFKRGLRNMKQLFVMFLFISGFLSPPVFAGTTMPVCGNQVLADADPEPDEEEEEPDCD
jgi:hypothetical protein